MTASSTFRLRVWSGEETTVALPIGAPGSLCTVELRCLPGASGIHVVLFDDKVVHLRAEVPADPGEVIPLKVELDETTTPHVSSRGRNLILLPGDERYDPVPPIAPWPPQSPLDLAIIIDGTLRNWEEKGGRLLDDKNLWGMYVEKLLDFAALIVDGRNWRATVIAFGDQEMPAVTAPDLRPRYHLYPPDDERSLRLLDLDRLLDTLLAVPVTPGGDFVDALADALAACERLRWREDARKVVVLIGDSPGCSLLYPLLKGADLCVRQLDVDTQASHLHRLGVEVLTIFNGPAAKVKIDVRPVEQELIRGARAQYFRLASLPELAFEAAVFEPHAAAERLERVATPIARGAALGELVRVADVEMAAETTPTAGQAETPAR